jgi:hypothetical protein
LNTHYWIDMKKDVAAVIMTQSLPFVEPRFMQAYADYERAVYAMWRSERAVTGRRLEQIPLDFRHSLRA